MRVNLIIFTVFSLLFAQNSFAANIYEVKDATGISKTSEATKMRDEAMQAAEVKAFDELQTRLVDNKYIPRKQTIPFSKVSVAVDSIDVVDEKQTDKGFKGVYDIVFSPFQISKIFSIQAIAPTKDPEKFLVIPIVAEDNQIKLWKNDWWPIWNDLSHDPIILPLADLQDVQSLKVEDLAAHHLGGLDKLAKRYGTNVTVFVQSQYDETKHTLSVQLEKIKGKKKTVVSYEYPGNRNIELDDLYQAGAQDIVYRLQNDKLTADNLTTVLNEDEAPATKPGPLHNGSSVTGPAAVPAPYSPDAPGVGFIGQKRPEYQPPKTDETVTPAPASKQAGNTSDAVVAAPDLVAWQRIRTKISAIPGVSLKIKSLNSGRAYITLNYDMDIEALKNSLSNQGLVAISSGNNIAIKEK